ncbi:MAG: Tannase and feruloyl esterase, partial [Acidobacteria bacterium]|nr:Tannase and feruloyl esterase [Acidobacteriota bacterium]
IPSATKNAYSKSSISAVSIAYYERQVRQFGKGEVEQFIRYYMIPGAGHGFGPFNARLECLPALEN